MLGFSALLALPFSDGNGYGAWVADANIIKIRPLCLKLGPSLSRPRPASSLSWRLRNNVCAVSLQTQHALLLISWRQLRPRSVTVALPPESFALLDSADRLSSILSYDGDPIISLRAIRFENHYTDVI